MAWTCNSCRGVICLALALTVVTASGCRLFRRAPSENRPSSAAVPPPTETTEPEQAEADEPEGPTPEETEVDVTLDAGAEDPDGTEAKPGDEAPPRTEPVPATASPAQEQSAEEKTDSPEPRLIPRADEVSLESMQKDLARAVRLSDVLADRALSVELRAQVDSGRSFLEDARAALEAEDLKRATVLLDKCLGLLEDAEYNSRP